MADQETQLRKEVLRTALMEFDTAHLAKIHSLAYDRWNWDTGTETDKEWMDVAECILRERGINMSNNNDTPIVPKTLFDLSNGQVVIGEDLKVALIDFLIEEVRSGMTWSSNKAAYLDSEIKDAARRAVRENI